MKHILLGLLSVLTAAGAFPAIFPDQPISLKGRWRFQLDRADEGLSDRWFSRTLPGKIRLPGTLTAQGMGDPISVETPWTGSIVDRSWFTEPEFAPYRTPGNVKVPFWLQPELHYSGAAWFQREIRIPKRWAGSRIVLFLERPHWETRVWVDDRSCGTNTSLATPHEYDLGLLMEGSHTLTIRVDNRMIIDIGENSHSISDQTQGNWNGIVGRIELRATPAAWIDDLQVYASARSGSVVVRGRAARASGSSPMGSIRLEIRSERDRKLMCHGTTDVNAAGDFEATLTPEGAGTWDEFSPVLHELTAIHSPGGGPGHLRRIRFGLRDIGTSGTEFTINGRKLFFRGTLECAIFPRTGHPAMEVSEWRRILRVCQAHGLNMLRFHSWCPPEAAFVAADELGFYLHVECSSWANQSTTLGDGKAVDDWIYAEADRILKTYGNHPSLVLFLYGNEPGGERHHEYLARWVQHYRTRDSRRLVSAGAGWPQLPGNQFHVTPDPRIQGWGEGLKSRINGSPPQTIVDYSDYVKARDVPVISHEIGQWCVHPNFNEMRKYTGYLKPRNFEIFRERMKVNGLLPFAEDFLRASGCLQAMCYKEEIESALRTRGMGGFQLLDLHDFPGQGTALVGVLDPFWGEKGYITPDEFRRFCNVTVPLARLKSRVFTTAESFHAGLEIAHFGRVPIPKAVTSWKFIDGKGTLYAHGELPAHDVPVGNGTVLGDVSVNLRNVRAPAQCRLVVGLRGTDVENDWDVWVYPAQTRHASGNRVMVTSRFDNDAMSLLVEGGSVLLTLPADRVRNFDKRPVRVGFSSIFWNTAWTAGQPPTTLGVLCDPEHPALADFPTESHSNWQWWYLLHRAGALRLDLLPRDTEPIVRVIDDWFTARPLGLIVEGRMLAGRIIICGFDLTRDADDPVSVQMRANLVNYLDSPTRDSLVEFTPEQVQDLIRADPR
jgi:hypothetical protein